jgi:acyl dehydratase
LTPVRGGERCLRRARFDAKAIRAFATLCGDMNPLHHDAERGRAQRSAVPSMRRVRCS